MSNRSTQVESTEVSAEVMARVARVARPIEDDAVFRPPPVGLSPKAKEALAKVQASLSAAREAEQAAEEKRRLIGVVASLPARRENMARRAAQLTSDAAALMAATVAAEQAAAQLRAGHAPPNVAVAPPSGAIRRARTEATVVVTDRDRELLEALKEQSKAPVFRAG